MKSGLFDINGIEIKVGDILLFSYRDGCKWYGEVTFEDGLFTVCYSRNIKQIKNPDGWDYNHNWCDSRYWSNLVGYPEFGAWNCFRKPLVKIAENFDSWDIAKGFYELYGFDKRIINAEIIIGEENE